MDEQWLKGNNRLSGCLFLIIWGLVTTITPAAYTQDLVINEFLASNSTILPDPDDAEYSDWIEIFNNSGTPLDIGGYYLTDNLTDTTKWQFPAGTVIAAGGFLMIWADGKDKSENTIHTNFKLEKTGEEIGLFTPARQPVDSIVYQMQETDVSFGRQPDADTSWYFFATPTPGVTNSTSGFLRAEVPEFSLEAGFFTSVQSLELSAGSENAVIRFTMDNSIPDELSDVYIDPITIDSRAGDPEVYSLIRTNQDPFLWLPDWVPPAGEIFKATVVRARTFEEGKEPSKTVTHTYFVDSEIEQRYPTLVVISIVTEPDNLFGHKSGIYVPGVYHQPGDSESGNYFMDWEKPAHIEFFEPGGIEAFSQDVGIKIQGGSSPASPQKGLHVFARSNYGSNRIEYPIFWNSKSKAKNLTEFKRFIIRAWGSMICGTLFSDAYAQSLFEESDLDIQAYRPAVVFINGEYWGLHELREANKNSWYYQFHYGIDRDNPGFDLLEHEGSGTNPYTVVDEGDASNWNAMASFILTHDMSDPSNYDYVKTQMNMENFITYMGHCIYTCKWDWPNNNDASWRPRTSTGKWKWIQFDMETCFGVGKELGPEYQELDAEYNMLEHVFEGIDLPTFGQYGPHHLARKLIENASFRNSLIQWFNVHMDEELSPENMNARLDSMVAEIEPYMDEYRNRWPFEIYFNNEWDHSIQLIRDFIQLRPQYMNQHLFEMFGTTAIENNDLLNGQNSDLFFARNWPNPVNDYTQFHFFLPNPCRVKITLHNVTGQVVTIIVDNNYPEGEHIYRWNPHTLPSGTYLYRITAGEFIQTRKLVIMR